MKTNKLNEIVDNTAMYVLLFVPIVICFISEVIYVLILKMKGIAKSDKVKNYE